MLLRHKRDATVVLALLVVAIIFFGRVLFLDQAAFWGDVIMAFYPAGELWRQAILRGELPLWNPLIFNGFPQFADAQYGTFYPGNALYLFLPVYRALAVDLAIHVWLLAVLTYAFLRRQGLGACPAGLGALAFAFSGFIAARVTQPPLIRSAVWLPLLLCIVQGAEKRVGVRTVVYVAVVVAAALLAGHMQTVLISVLLATVFAVWRGAARNRDAKEYARWLAQFWAALLAGLVVAAGLAAVQVIPAAELVRHSDRAGGTSFAFASSFSLPIRQLPMLFAPDLFGNPMHGIYVGDWLYWEMVGYFGTVTILLTLLGLFCARRRDRIFWGVTGILGIGLALGDASPLYRLAFEFVPGVAYFRVPTRFFLWYGLAVAVLAAYGTEWLMAQRTPGRSWAVFVILATAGVLAAAYWAAPGPGASVLLDRLRGLGQTSVSAQALAYLRDVGLEEGRRFAVLWTAGFAVIALTIYRRLGVRLSLALLIGLVMGDLVAFGANLYPTVSARDLSARPRTAEVLDLEEDAYRILTTPAFSNGTWARTMSSALGLSTPEDFARFRTALIPNTHVLSRIPNVWGYSPILLRQTLQVLGLAIGQADRQGGRSPMIDFMGAKYIFTGVDMRDAYDLMYQGGFYVWRNGRALPRGYLVTDYRVVSGETEVGRALTEQWNPSRTVVLADPPGIPAVRSATPPGTITRRSYGLSKVVFDVALTRPALLVLSDTYYPGWKAYIDGVERPILRANRAFRAVPVPAGTRRVEFVFVPQSLRLGGVISVASWLLVLGLILVGYKVSRNLGRTPATLIGE